MVSQVVPAQAGTLRGHGSGVDTVSQAGTLRAHLKAGTRALHDELDEKLAPAALGDDQSYAMFLSAQYAARLPVERWLENAAIPFAPPVQCQLIAADLHAMGRATPAATDPFSLPENAEPVGAFWALAGSSLGNRAMLAQRRKANLSAPVRFLSDEAMPAYFKKLRPFLEQSVAHSHAQSAIRAADAVFRQFLLTQDAVRLAA